MTADAGRLAYWLNKKVNQAIYDFAMIAGGDRVAVGVSGGEDSLTLLRLLDLRRRAAPEQYEIVAIHVSCDTRGAETMLHEPLRDWLAASGLEHRIERVSLPEDEQVPLSCQRCAWHRRRTLFQAAHEAGCGVVALGHHADDLAETALANILFHGRPESMLPKRDYFSHKLTLVRPLCLLTKKEIDRFARASRFPPPPPPCPRGEESLRALSRQILGQIPAQMIDQVRANLLRLGREYAECAEEEE